LNLTVSKEKIPTIPRGFKEARNTLGAFFPCLAAPVEASKKDTAKSLLPAIILELRMRDGATEDTARRLAAIMFTDMVGYAALMQSDEEQALTVLERHNRLLRPFFPKLGGREGEDDGRFFPCRIRERSGCDKVRD
jgi:hypothetical protein